MKYISFLRLGAILGALTVIIGAFGAHGLKPQLSEYQMAIFEKGVQYQFYHSLAMLVLGVLQRQMPENAWIRQAGWLFFAGIAGFSGSLYLLACRDLLPFSVTWAGPVTPIGGLFFISGWLRLAFGVGKS
jgi:uncharacterized membrane protein YgdD (TMEM256/DUF423 family)